MIYGICGGLLGSYRYNISVVVADWHSAQRRAVPDHVIRREGFYPIAIKGAVAPCLMTQAHFTQICCGHGFGSVRYCSLGSSLRPDGSNGSPANFSPS